jgi:SAM-dependent methyltransferase
MPHRRKARRTALTYRIFQPAETHGRPRGGWSDTDPDERLLLCDIQQPTCRLLLEHLPENGVILESGCGTGRWVKFLSDRGYTVVGLDSSTEGLDRSREAWTDLLLAAGDALELPFAGGSVSAVMTLGVIEHFEEGPGAFLDEIVRVLEPGGRVYITSPFDSLCRTLVHRPAMRVIRTIAGLLRRGWVFTEYRYGRRHLRERIETSGLVVEGEYPEDLDSPGRDIALHVDWLCIFRGRGEFGLNLPGRLVKRVASILPRWWRASSLLFVCRKPL